MLTLPLLMDVLLHLEFLNPQVQRTPTSSECPLPWVPQVGGLNQVQIGSWEGHSQTFASPPSHFLWPARIGPVPPGCLYLRQYEENRYDKIFTRCHLCTPAPCKCLLLRVDYSTCKLPLEFASSQDRAICASFSLEWNLFSAKIAQITTKLNRVWHNTR